MAINKAPHWVLQKELTFDFGQKIENFVFCFVGQNRSIYNVW